MITYDKQLFSSLSYWTSFAASFRTSAMFAVVISQLRNHAKVLHALWHDRRPTEFQHNDIMMKTPVQNDWDLRWHLGQCGLSCAHEGQTKNNWKKGACASNCALTSTSHWLHKSGSTGLFHTSSCRKHFEFLKEKRSSYCCTWSRDFSSLRSLPQSVGREYQHAAYASIQVHTAYPSIQVHTAYTSIQVHTAYTSIQVHTATGAFAVYASVLQFCQSLPTSSCRYNSSDLCVVHASSPEPLGLATLKRMVFLFASECD